MVNDESGFEGGEIADVKDTTCASENVRRRRRASDMCACRRRDSGKRYDGRWVCQNDRMVQEAPEWTEPVWFDEFNGPEVNQSKWVLTYSGSGNGNNEEQYYTGGRSENMQIVDGVLKLVGKREEFKGTDGRTKPFTSGKMTSRNKGDWGPGHRFEIRAKLPLGVGTWPAIWMMPTDSEYGGWPKSGEIDIMECIGRSHGKVFGTIHTDAYNHMKGTQKGRSFYTDFSEWHTYALDWEENRLKWYADGNLYNTFEPHNVLDSREWPFDKSFYMILNLAIGGNLGGSARFYDDQIMEIDYVRVYCLDGTTTCPQVPEKKSCCESCSGTSFCSPISGACYDSKKKDYYETCAGGDELPKTSPATGGCCSECPGSGFCSPESGNCYGAKKKDYYVSCSD